MGWKQLGKWDSAARCGEFFLDRGLCPKFAVADSGPSGSAAVLDGARSSAPKALNGITVLDHNKDGFAHWQNSYEGQFNNTFRAIGVDRVNCWVRIENLRD